MCCNDVAGRKTLDRDRGGQTHSRGPRKSPFFTLRERKRYKGHYSVFRGEGKGGGGKKLSWLREKEKRQITKLLGREGAYHSSAQRDGKIHVIEKRGEPCQCITKLSRHSREKGEESERTADEERRRCGLGGKTLLLLGREGTSPPLAEKKYLYPINFQRGKGKTAFHGSSGGGKKKTKETNREKTDTYHVSPGIKTERGRGK